MRRSIIFTLTLLIPSFAFAQDDTSHILNCVQPSGHHLSYRGYSCPLGGESFKSLRLGTHSIFGRHLDFKPVSYLDFPAPVPICPSNGFVITKKDYTTEEISTIKALIETDSYQSLYKERHASFYLFAYIADALKEEDVNQWWLLLKASWEADTCGDEAKYKRYALETIEAAKIALQKGGKENQHYIALNTLVPNLYRRIGDFDAAQNWLSNLNDLPQLNAHERLRFTLLKEAISSKNSEPVEAKKPK